jgi:hypothetical protein
MASGHVQVGVFIGRDLASLAGDGAWPPSANERLTGALTSAPNGGI